MLLTKLLLGCVDLSGGAAAALANSSLQKASMSSGETAWEGEGAKPEAKARSRLLE